MAELRETNTHVIREKDGNGATPWLAFIIGALLIALVAFFFLYGRASVTTGPGVNHVELSVKGPAAPPPAQ